MLALHLLDILVKNCGYPFHLQISTKEFLNELVKRFPERPPLHPSAVHRKILEMIHEWRQTLCVTSKHKEDLVHIRDMHRLLTYKGYRFPKLDSRSTAVLNHQEQIMSPEEMEEEDRDAQSAKLQELIRRGTPRDLAQAQELMKVLSGAEPEKNEDYGAKVGKELEKVKARIKLLNDMLDQAKPADKPVSGDAYDQVASHLRSVQPRLQRWINHAEANGSDQLAPYLEVNDAINQVFQRYASFSKGQGAGASRGNDLISWDDSVTDGEKEDAPRAKAPAALSDLDELSLLSLGPDPAPVSSGSMTQPAQPQSAAQSERASPQKPSSTGKQRAQDLLGDLDDAVGKIRIGSPAAPSAAQPPAPAAPSAGRDPFAGLEDLL